MSYPHPHGRDRDQTEKGEQPYKDAKEAMAKNEATIQNEAEAFGEAHQRETDEERSQRLAAEAETALQAVSKDLKRAPQEG
ncbi:MAG: hypothetical protein M3464_09315 [Chloroflexota bacterium]|nr:hypothetical protein [Chloroflexota bacterium]